MNTAIYATTWHGIGAWVLETACLRIVVLPTLGAKIASLLDKRSGREWLIGPGEKVLRSAPYGALFHEQDMSGWDEMFPTIVACTYPGEGDHQGVGLPDHGEVWALPWSVVQAGDGCVTLAVEGVALPYRLTRTLSFSALDTLEMRYRLTNLAQHAMPYIWAAHPQFACEAGAEIILPPEISELCNTLPADWGWGAPETRVGWPEARSASGHAVRIDRVGPPTLRRGRKFFALPDAHPQWARVVQRPSGDWLHLSWNPTAVPYFGLWVDEGALSSQSVAAPEPTTGFYDSLAVAWQKQEVTVVQPGATHEWLITLRVGVGDQPIAMESGM